MKATSPAVWVFGYGSLVWKPPKGAESTPTVPGYIEGYRRVWWMHSTDHRGTPDYPGRTVSIVEDPSPGARVWGVATRISEGLDEREREKLLADLDHREKQYDRRLQLDVFGEDGSLLAPSAITYMGTPSCANWGGEASLDDIAHTIATAHGPSGPNTEYLFRLCDAFREMGAERAEPELFELEEKVRERVRSADV